MSEKRATCTCGGEPVPGTLYCWRPHCRRPVAGFIADEGQLLWQTRTEDGASRVEERALAVLVDDQLVEVESAKVDVGSRPARLLLKVKHPNRPGNAAVDMQVELRELVEVLAGGGETVTASHGRPH